MRLNISRNQGSPHPPKKTYPYENRASREENQGEKKITYEETFEP